MTSVSFIAAGACAVFNGPILRSRSFGNSRPAAFPFTGRGQQILAKSRHRRRRCCGVLRVSATSVTERYEDAEAKDPIRPLRHPVAAWQRWWYIGATPQAELPQSQKFSKICARLWSIMKHSKTSLSFAVTFMVSWNIASRMYTWLLCSNQLVCKHSLHLAQGHQLMLHGRVKQGANFDVENCAKHDHPPASVLWQA